MLNDFGYIDKAIANIKEVAEKQEQNIKAAASLPTLHVTRRRLPSCWQLFGKSE